jgi:thymidine kinase
MICLFIGPMYSSKTTTLLARLERYELGGKKCIIIKYKNDNRYDTDSMVVTHSQYKHDAICAITLADIDHLIDSYDVILIDEIQFYNDAAFMCDIWANKGKIVECYGLSGDYKREPFEQISKLIPLCDKITHLTAIDRTNGEDAPFSFRMNNDTKQEIIGGEDMYIALSRKSYLKMYNQKIMSNKECLNTI